MTHRADLRRLVAEGVGTFFLVLIGPGAVMVDAYTGGAIGHTGVALAFAFVVTTMVYALGHLSGAHINPAVTIGFWSVRRFPSREVGPYLVAQLLGAVAASGFLRGVLGPVGHVGATLPSLPVGSAFAVEWGSCALTGGPLTGASKNPARSFGPAFVGGTWTAHWIYWAAPITAMVTAARLYDFLRGAPGVRVVAPGLALGVEGPIDEPASRLH